MVLGNHPLVKAPGNIFQWMTHQPNSLNFIKEKRGASVKRKTEKRFDACALVMVSLERMYRMAGLCTSSGIILYIYIDVNPPRITGRV